MTDRYYVIDGSESGHCCFEYTVMDATKDEQVCECFDINHAELICSALNKEPAK